MHLSAHDQSVSKSALCAIESAWVEDVISLKFECRVQRRELLLSNHHPFTID